MSGLREAKLGPLVGHTSHESSRIWIRAEDSETGAGSEERTLGVIAIVPAKDLENAPEKSQAYYFRMHRENDRTGVFTFGVSSCLTGKKSAELKAGTDYVVRAGTLIVDDPFGDDENVSSGKLSDKLPDPNVWINDLLSLRPKFSEARFRTFPDPAQGVSPSLAFIVGSCRYPGVLWKIKDADRIFGPLAKEAIEGAPASGLEKARRPTDLTLMVGDQIYADMLNRHIPIGLADTFEEFQERYLTAFGSRKMRRLLRHVPTYMILDDHEIADNWHQDRIKKAEARRVFNLAINAYKNYQWSHSPDSYNGRLYYKFDCGGYPFFVLDTRTQRYFEDVEDSLEDNHLLGRPALPGDEPNQLDRLLHWLREQQKTNGNVPKFVVTSSVFAPNPMSARTGRNGTPEQKVKWAEDSDSWPAFPNTRRAILKTIIEQKIQNVVFLAGDIHCATVAELSFNGPGSASDIKAFSIVSSAFYWPFPFADGEPSNFVHNSTMNGQEDWFDIDEHHVMNYTARNFTQEDNYCRVDVDKESHSIKVMPFDNEGKLIHDRDFFGNSKSPLDSRLLLAPW